MWKETRWERFCLRRWPTWSRKRDRIYVCSPGLRGRRGDPHRRTCIFGTVYRPHPKKDQRAWNGCGISGRRLDWLALAEGALRVLRGEEKAIPYVQQRGNSRIERMGGWPYEEKILCDDRKLWKWKDGIVTEPGHPECPGREKDGAGRPGYCQSLFSQCFS